MSIEADLGAFRDLALEEQIKIPYYEKKFDDLSLVFRNLDPILAEIVEDNKVSVNGECYLPDLDDEGRVIGTLHYTYSEAPVIGESGGIAIAKRNSLDEFADDSRVIGYHVFLPKIKRVSPLEVTHTQLYAFAPVESSTLHVPELVVPPEQILPEPDDDVAQSIDEIILNDPKNFGHLDRLFKEVALESDLRVDFYLTYLNRIFRIKDYVAKLTTTQLYEEREDCYVDTHANGNETDVSMYPDRFAFIETLGGLCLLTEEAADATYLIPIAGLTRAKFSLREEAETHQ